jgi:hypothetical protein
MQTTLHEPAYGLGIDTGGTFCDKDPLTTTRGVCV